MIDHYILINSDSRIVSITTVPKNYVPAYADCIAVKVDDVKNFQLNALYIDGAMVVDTPITLPMFVQAPYRAKRAAAYPSVKDQLDMLWKAMNEGSMPKAEPFYSVIAGVKNQFPKDISTPNSETVIL